MACDTTIKVYHVGLVIMYALFWYYDQNFLDLSKFSPKNDIKFMKGRLKFLTMWNMVLQTIFFIICLINDIVGTNETRPHKKPFIRTLKDRLLACLAFPLAMFVGITFWGLYAVDRELVFPKALDEFFPSWLNHVMHTNIMIFILIEMATTFRKYPSRKFGLSVLSAFMACYLVWIHVIHYHSGVWVYPVLEVLNLPMRIVFLATLLIFSIGLYILGEKLNGMLWADEMKHASRHVAAGGAKVE